MVLTPREATRVVQQGTTQFSALRPTATRRNTLQRTVTQGRTHLLTPQEEMRAVHQDFTEQTANIAQQPAHASAIECDMGVPRVDPLFTSRSPHANHTHEHTHFPHTNRTPSPHLLHSHSAFATHTHASPHAAHTHHPHAPPLSLSPTNFDPDFRLFKIDSPHSRAERGANPNTR